MCQHLCYHKLISAVQNPKHVCSESYPCVLLLVVAVAVAVAVAVVVAVVVVDDDVDDGWIVVMDCGSYDFPG